MNFVVHASSIPRSQKPTTGPYLRQLNPVDIFKVRLFKTQLTLTVRNFTV
jgi:hypothetical protein